MTDRSWLMGWKQLQVCCREKDMTPEDEATKSRCYRDDLNHLSDERWLYAVRQLRGAGWFPSVQEIECAALSMPAPAVPARLALPEDTRTRDEKRADAKRWLERIRGIVERGDPVPEVE